MSRLRIVSVLLLGPVAGGCARLTVPEPPSPIPTPEVAVETPDLNEVPTDVPAPVEEVEYDPILHSPWAAWPGFRSEIDRWVDHWAGRQSRDFETYLERMAYYESLVDTALGRASLPRSLRYLPIIESGYTTHAVSRASAVGIWQLMAPTARAEGIRVGTFVDERRDPIRATDVALRYLGELYERFDSWYLALAAYNGGPSRLQRLLDRHAPGATPSDSLYFTIRGYLPRETQDFVPRFLAAAEVARDPGAFGIRAPAQGPLFEYDVVTVPDATSLDVVAQAAGVSETAVTELNPHVLRGVTSRGIPTTLRVPKGSGWRFNVEFPKIPPGRRVTATEHVVARGETLWGIARRYGVRLDTLEQANPSIRPERLQPGDRLLVPLLPEAVRGG